MSLEGTIVSLQRLFHAQNPVDYSYRYAMTSSEYYCDYFDSEPVKGLTVSAVLILEPVRGLTIS